MRQFIRHPADIPLHIAHDGYRDDQARMRNISGGGLCFESPAFVPPRQRIHIEIKHCQPPFCAEATVCWCRKAERGFEIGVCFDDEQVHFAMRMTEQVCHIEAYRQRVLETENRELTQEQAAQEWIERYAAMFPQ